MTFILTFWPCFVPGTKNDKSFYPGKTITTSADFGDTDVVLPAHFNWFVEGIGATSVSPWLPYPPRCPKLVFSSHILPLFHRGSKRARNDLVKGHNRRSESSCTGHRPGLVRLTFSYWAHCHRQSAMSATPHRNPLAGPPSRL